MRVVTPLATHKIQTTETQMHFFVTARQVDSCKTNRLEVADRTYAFGVGALQRYLELIPGDRYHLTVTQLDIRDQLLNDILSADLHLRLAQTDMIFVELLVLVERVVVVDILYIRLQGCRHTVSAGTGLG